MLRFSKESPAEWFDKSVECLAANETPDNAITTGGKAETRWRLLVPVLKIVFVLLLRGVILNLVCKQDNIFVFAILLSIGRGEGLGERGVNTRPSFRESHDLLKLGSVS